MSISFVYLYDYFSSQKYKVESSIIEDLIDPKIKKELLQKDELNPEKYFTIELYDDEGNILSNNFIIKDFRTKKILDRGVPFKRRISDFELKIEYICEDDYCTRRKEDKAFLHYYIEIKYLGFIIDHQSTDSPIKNDSNIIFGEKYPFFFIIQ
jgi:hypothetical protein